MNPHERRRAAREQAKTPLLCPPGRHSFARWSGTYQGAEVAVRVVCTTCRRPIETVFEQQPEELAGYRAWLEAGAPGA